MSVIVVAYWSFTMCQAWEKSALIVSLFFPSVYEVSSVIIPISHVKQKWLLVPLGPSGSGSLSS